MFEKVQVAPIPPHSFNRNEFIRDKNSFRVTIRPLKFKLLLTCIDIFDDNKGNRICGKVLLMIFNVLWILIMTSKVLCFSVTSVDIFILDFTSKLLSYVIWWILYCRRSFIRDSLQRIHILKRSIRPQNRHRFKIGLKTCIGLFLAIIFIYSIHGTIRFLTRKQRRRSGYSKFDRCRSLTVPLQSISGKAAVKFLSVFLNHYVDWNVQFSVVVLYCYCCYELEKIICALSSKRQSLTPREFWEAYNQIRKCLKTLEERFSLLVFFFFARSFTEFFRVLTFLLNKMKVRLDVSVSVASGIFSTVILITFVVVVIRASNLLKCYKKLCLKMISIPKETNGMDDDFETRRSWHLLMDDKSRISLTAWGTFHLTKNLCMTATATLVSYGIIVYQFHSWR
ncbi:hypothetical protein AVEN_52428-1 [Araneus ventricosus]|uniref:Gustatory receptor n=1 Tax=Araneus ventricosus TaxID=182803 RepID=A0A4Y2CWW7_ARAVE|nr:hypothetical protein AVEN_52428-1 [Araneus ventricosus]